MPGMALAPDSQIGCVIPMIACILACFYMAVGGMAGFAGGAGLPAIRGSQEELQRPELKGLLMEASECRQPTQFLYIESSCAAVIAQGKPKQGGWSWHVPTLLAPSGDCMSHVSALR